MDVHNRRHHLSTLIVLKKNQLSQTKLSYLTDIGRMIRYDEIPNINTIRTNDPNQIERQIQVDTRQENCTDSYKIVDPIETNLIINDMKVLRALIDRNGK